MAQWHNVKYNLLSKPLPCSRNENIVPIFWNILWWGFWYRNTCPCQMLCAEMIYMDGSITYVTSIYRLSLTFIQISLVHSAHQILLQNFDDISLSSPVCAFIPGLSIFISHICFTSTYCNSDMKFWCRHVWKERWSNILYFVFFSVVTTRFKTCQHSDITWHHTYREVSYSSLWISGELSCI